MPGDFARYPNIYLPGDTASHTLDFMVLNHRAVRVLCLGVADDLLVESPLHLPIDFRIGCPVRQFGKGIWRKKRHRPYDINTPQPG